MNTTPTQTPRPLHWRDLGVKDKSALVTAVISFILGFVLLFTGMFIDPAGIIDTSVLTGFGTALLYTAGIYGVALYFKNGQNEFLTTMLDAIDDRIERRLKKAEEANDNDNLD